MWDILEQIWELPWYKILVIAAADDVIVFLRIWWLWLGFVIIAVLLLVYKTRKD